MSIESSFSAEKPCETGSLLKSLSTLRLPRVEPTTFIGNPEYYHEFIYSFETLIEKFTADPAERLVYLHHYLGESVRTDVSGCFYLDREIGYREARRILE